MFPRRFRTACPPRTKADRVPSEREGRYRRAVAGSSKGQDLRVAVAVMGHLSFGIGRKPQTKTDARHRFSAHAGSVSRKRGQLRLPGTAKKESQSVE